MAFRQAAVEDGHAHKGCVRKQTNNKRKANQGNAVVDFAKAISSPEAEHPSNRGRTSHRAMASSDIMRSQDTVSLSSSGHVTGPPTACGDAALVFGEVGALLNAISLSNCQVLRHTDCPSGRLSLEMLAKATPIYPLRGCAHHAHLHAVHGTLVCVRQPPSTRVVELLEMSCVTHASNCQESWGACVVGLGAVGC